MKTKRVYRNNEKKIIIGVVLGVCGALTKVMSDCGALIFDIALISLSAKTSWSAKYNTNFSEALIELERFGSLEVNR